MSIALLQESFVMALCRGGVMYSFSLFCLFLDIPSGGGCEDFNDVLLLSVI